MRRSALFISKWQAIHRYTDLRRQSTKSREETGVSEEGLRSRLGLLLGTFNVIEAGLIDVRISTLEKLAVALDTAPGILLDG
jgi:predicted transcriptional regulator